MPSHQLTQPKPARSLCKSTTTHGSRQGWHEVPPTAEQASEASRPHRQQATAWCTGAPAAGGRHHGRLRLGSPGKAATPGHGSRYPRAREAGTVHGSAEKQAWSRSRGDPRVAFTQMQGGR